MMNGTCESCVYYAPDFNEEPEDVDGKRVMKKVEAETGGCHYNPPKEYLLANAPGRPPIVLGVWPRVNARQGWCRMYLLDGSRLEVIRKREAAAKKEPVQEAPEEKKVIIA